MYNMFHLIGISDRQVPVLPSSERFTHFSIKSSSGLLQFFLYRELKDFAAQSLKFGSVSKAQINKCKNRASCLQSAQRLHS